MSAIPNHGRHGPRADSPSRPKSGAHVGTVAAHGMVGRQMDNLQRREVVHWHIIISTPKTTAFGVKILPIVHHFFLGLKDGDASISLELPRLVQGHPASLVGIGCNRSKRCDATLKT